MKKKSRYVIIALALIGVFIAVINIQALNELWDLKNSFNNTSAVRITLKDYRSGRTIEGINNAALEEICEEVSNIQYRGLYLGKDRIDPDDQAYSLVISTEDSQEILIITASGSQSRIVRSVFPISIKNCDGLYRVVKASFE